jgi:FlaG/FlaF family flagellin (archaellin)
MKPNNNETAVSAVIGVVLCVAIVCILAAIVGAFAFGMVGGQQKGHAIGVTGTYKSGTVNLVLNSGTQEDVALLDYIDVTINGASQISWSPKTAGETTTYAGPFAHPCKVEMIAHYSPNDQTVIMETLNF